VVALVIFTRRGDIMGRFANRGATQGAAVAGTALILALNLFLIVQTIEM
jgi:manganese transport protein